jgi:SsrA-binding protein
MAVLSSNKKAYFEYQILKKIEAGIILTGQEVKSSRLGRMSLIGSYVVLREGEVYLVGTNIPPYQPKNITTDYNPGQPRKLLLKKAEIEYLIGKTKEKGLTLVPLRVYTNKRKIKLEIGIAKGKKKRDKREEIKKRETRRDMRESSRG